MRNNLFSAIRLYTEQKGLNNELKSMQSKANELNKKANINPMGQIQMPLSELRSVLTDSASTKVNEFVITPTATIIERSRFLQGLEANAKYPIINTKCTKWETESADTADITSVELRPYRMYSEIVYSDTLIKSTDATLQYALSEDLISNIYNKVESTLLSTDNGTNGNPKGILTYITPNTSSALSIGDFTTIEKAFFESGAKEPIYIFSPSSYKTTKETFKELFSGGKFNNFEYVVTNNLQNDYILLCDLNYLLVGLFGGLDVQIDDVTERIKGKVKLLCNTYWDYNITNKDAFQAIKIQ